MTFIVAHRRGESYKEPSVVMDAQIENQDFTVLALYLVPQFVVCEARTIADRWNGSLDGCDTERPRLPGRPLFGASARRAGCCFLFHDATTVRTRFFGELHFSS